MTTIKVSHHNKSTKYNYGIGDTHEEKFWSRVNKTSNLNGCWEWTAKLKNNGYGQITINWKKIYIHRYSWFLVYGKMPNLLILHRCDNRKCVNPTHLFEGTTQDNIADKVAKNRQPKGAQTGHTKITESDVLEIRKRLSEGESQPSIAKDYGVSQSNISHIKRGLNWKHI